jgi:hypothetical protein
LREKLPKVRPLFKEINAHFRGGNLWLLWMLEHQHQPKIDDQPIIQPVTILVTIIVIVIDIPPSTNYNHIHSHGYQNHHHTMCINHVHEPIPYHVHQPCTITYTIPCMNHASTMYQNMYHTMYINHVLEPVPYHVHQLCTKPIPYHVPKHVPYHLSKSPRSASNNVQYHLQLVNHNITKMYLNITNHVPYDMLSVVTITSMINHKPQSYTKTMYQVPSMTYSKPDTKIVNIFL